MITIHDIAKRLGVNPSTVSRALSNSSGVSSDLRQRVARTAEEMGYQPNLMARHLRRQTSSILGLIVDEEWHWYASSIAEGVQAEARQQGLYVMIWNARSEADQSAGLGIFEQMRVAGVIVASMHVDQSRSVPNAAVPLVVINRVAGNAAPSILADDEYGAVLAILHLLALGHRDIAFINGPEDWVQPNERLRGVTMALKSAGLTLRDEWYGIGDWQRESGNRESLRILNTDPRPTAIFVGNDEMAVGAYAAARTLGLAIPDDLSIVGYNNHTSCAYMVPALTTVTLPNWQMGSVAVKMLCQQIGHAKGISGPQYVKGELILRESTAPPARRTTQA